MAALNTFTPTVSLGRAGGGLAINAERRHADDADRLNFAAARRDQCMFERLDDTRIGLAERH